MRLLGKLVRLKPRPDGRSLKLYGTTTSKFGRGRFLEDCATLFELLGEDRIKPIIMRRSPILEATATNELLQSGQDVGTVVLVVPQHL